MWAAVAACVLVAGCSSFRPDEPVVQGPIPSRPPTTVTTSTSTTAAPPTTQPPVPLTEAKAVTSPTGVVVPVLGPFGEGVKVSTPCGNEAVLTQGTGHREIDVVLDPGHGGSEAGAADPRGEGYTEKVVNLAVTERVAAALAKEGVRTLMTRTSDYRVTLAARAKIAQTVKPRAFVSVHFNGESDEPSAKPGTETYYQVDSPTAAESKRLAGLIYEEVVKALSQFQGIPWEADRDAGAKYRRNTKGGDYYAVLRLTKGVTAVLAEIAFHSNPPERDLFQRDDARQVAADAVARGILRFLRTSDPGSGFTEPYPRSSPAGGGGGGSNCVDPPLA
jgi:N-acetylmuramoyl-L-alanine amidase